MEILRNLLNLNPLPDHNVDVDEVEHATDIVERQHQRIVESMPESLRRKAAARARTLRDIDHIKELDLDSAYWSPSASDLDRNTERER
jgi:hypothetical protein